MRVRLLTADGGLIGAEDYPDDWLPGPGAVRIEDYVIEFGRTDHT